MQTITSTDQKKQSRKKVRRETEKASQDEDDLNTAGNNGGNDSDNWCAEFTQDVLHHKHSASIHVPSDPNSDRREKKKTREQQLETTR